MKNINICPISEDTGKGAGAKAPAKERAPLLATNLDTDFLKLIAVVTMVFDHVGSDFFPDQLWFRLVGRLTFPLFCYCMTVGLLYTRDIRKYFLRLGVFAVITQPIYSWNANPLHPLENITSWNIFFTLLISLVAVWGFKERKYWLFALGLVVINVWNFDYGMMGILMMLIFYCCRNRRGLGAALTFALMVFWSLNGDSIHLFGLGFDMSLTSVFAIPLIYLHTNVNPRVNKYFFYAFYPAHLAVIALAQTLLGA